MLQRKKPTPNELYYRYLLGDAVVGEIGTRLMLNDFVFKTGKTGLCDQPSNCIKPAAKKQLLEWLQSFQALHEIKYEYPIKIEKSVLQRIFSAPLRSPAPVVSSPIKTAQPSMKHALTANFVEPCAVIQRQQTSDEKKPNPTLIKNTLPTRTAAQITLLQQTAEASSDAFTSLMEQAPYDHFKNAFKSQSKRSDRRTAYHDAAQCLPPNHFLKLINDCHTSDPNTFFQIMHKQDIDGRTVLHLAAQYQPFDVFLELLSRIVKYKNADSVLTIQSHDQWDVLFLVARFQTPLVLNTLLTHLTMDFIMRRMEALEPCSFIAIMAHSDEMLKCVSNKVTPPIFRVLLNNNMTEMKLQKKPHHNPFLTAMHFEKSFVFLSSLISSITLYDALIRRDDNEIELLMIFLPTAAASEELSLDLLDQLINSEIEERILRYRNEPSVFAAILCRQTAAVINTVISALNIMYAKATLLSSLKFLFEQPITQQEKINLIMKIDFDYLLEPEIFSYIKSQTEPGSLKNAIRRDLLRDIENGNTWLHVVLSKVSLAAPAVGLTNSIMQLAEMKDEEGLVNQAITIQNAEGETPLDIALKHNHHLALCLMRVASLKALQTCIRQSEEDLVLRIARGSFNCFKALLDKLNEDELRNVLTPVNIDILVSNIDIESLFEIFNNQSPPMLYVLFMKAQRREMAYDRLASASPARASELFGKLSLVMNTSGFEALLKSIAAHSFSQLIEMINRDAVLREKVNSTRIKYFILDMILHATGKFVTSDNVFRVFEFLRPLLSQDNFKKTASDILVTISPPLREESLQLLLTSVAHHFPDILQEFFDKISTATFSNFLSRLTVNDLVIVFTLVRADPRLLEKKFDEPVLQVIRTRITLNNEPQSLRNYPALRKIINNPDPGLWPLLDPFVVTSAMHDIIRYCSDSLLIALMKNSSIFFSSIIQHENDDKWNLLHSLLYYRNSQTVLAILSQFDDYNWREVDAILDAQDNEGETCLHTACYRDEKVFELIVRKSSQRALSKAASLVTSGSPTQSVLEYALPKQTPSVIAEFLLKLSDDRFTFLVRRDWPLPTDRLPFQLACHVIHEPSWQTEAMLGRLFEAIGELLVLHIKKLPTSRIPLAVIKKSLRFLGGDSKADQALKSEWTARITPQSAQKPKVLTQLKRDSFFLTVPIDPVEKKENAYAKQLDEINQLAENNHLAIKMFRDKECWKDFIKQLSDYHYRPKLRIEIDKTKPLFKFFHLEKNEDKKIRPYEYKTKSVFDATKKQSVSFIPKTLGTPVFGEQHPGRELVGVLIDFKIDDIKAMFIRDKGTYHRGWVGATREAVEKYQREISEFNYTDFDGFCKEVASHPDRLNEMLLKLTRESIKAVVLAKDTPDARKIALQRQLDLEKIKIDVPIVYYDRLARAMRPLNTEMYASEQKLKI